MRRAVYASLSLLLTLGWITGCGGSSSGSGLGSTQPNALNGQYAFVLAGFDSNGAPVGIAGSLKADGMGHITAGDVDVNDSGTATIVSSTSVTGTYAFDAAGSGTLGTITLTNTLGSLSPLAFAFSLQASGDFGGIMSADANGFDAGGTIQLQNSSVFTFAGMAGSYVATINGRNSSNPTSVLGRFTLASSGATTNVAFDRSEAGTTTGSASASSATVSLAGAGPDTNGRGTLTLAITDTFGSTNQTFAYYAITATRFVAVETDTGGTQTADFAGQASIPATPTTTGAVFGMAGVDTSVSNEITAVGQLQMTGVGATAATVNLDSNDNGDIHSGVSLIGQDVAVYDSTTGRGTLTVAAGTANGLANTLVFYLTAPGAGFIMDATAGATNRAMAGPLMAQAAGPYSAATDLNAGLGIVRSRASIAVNAFSLVGLFGLTTNDVNYEILFDQRSSFGANLVTSPLDNPDSSIVLGSLDATVGRGTLSIQDTGATEVFYIIGPNQFYFIDITGGGNPSTVYFVSPD